MLSNVQFLIVLNVDCGTPLFIDNPYCDKPCSSHNSRILLEIASFNRMMSPPSILQLLDKSIESYGKTILRALEVNERNM